MKLIEKYQQKFIELLKEAENELGGELTITVTSTTTRRIDSDTFLGYAKTKEYKCSISTANNYLI